MFFGSIHVRQEPHIPLAQFNTHLASWMRTMMAHRPVSPHTLAAPISANTSTHSRTLSHVSSFCWGSDCKARGRQVCEEAQAGWLHFIAQISISNYIKKIQLGGKNSNELAGIQVGVPAINALDWLGPFSFMQSLSHRDLCPRTVSDYM